MIRHFVRPPRTGSRSDPIRSGQPPAGDPLWKGHNPADGAVYQLRCPGDVLGAGGAQGTWQVRWAEGEDYFFRSSSTSVRVNELHVVTAADPRRLD